MYDVCTHFPQEVDRIINICRIIYTQGTFHSMTLHYANAMTISE